MSPNVLGHEDKYVHGQACHTCPIDAPMLLDDEVVAQVPMEDSSDEKANKWHSGVAHTVQASPVEVSETLQD